jgi:hypothetical protein
LDLANKEKNTMRRILVYIAITLFVTTGHVAAQNSTGTTDNGNNDNGTHKKEYGIMTIAEAKYQEALRNGVKPDPVKAQKLVDRTYKGPFKLWYADDYYIGHSLGLEKRGGKQQSDNLLWIAVDGQFQDLTPGYWIFLPDQHMCWQALNTNDRIRYWNADRMAKGSPEDWELFLFKDAGTDKGVVKIMNIYGSYVRYFGGELSADGTIDSADVFIVE